MVRILEQTAQALDDTSLRAWTGLAGRVPRLSPGQSVVEYALMVALVALAAAVIARTLGTDISTTLSKANSYLSGG